MPDLNAIGSQFFLHDAGEALDRLIVVARRDTHQSRIVADFLLAWWDGHTFGDFHIIDICNVDRAIAADMLVVLHWLARNGTAYADAFGRRADMVGLVQQWRSCD
jgi:hypothetical protein